MARTAITPQAAVPAGLAAAFEPANVDGNSFTPRRGRALHVANGSGSSVTVTIDVPGTADGLAIADRTVAVAASGHAVIYLGPPETTGIYQQLDGAVHADYSSVTSVTVAVIDTP